MFHNHFIGTTCKLFISLNDITIVSEPARITSAIESRASDVSFVNKLP